MDTKIDKWSIEAEPYLNKKIFGSQKVKLYKIKHFIFDFGGVMVEKTFTLKNLFDIIEDDLKILIPRSKNSYMKKLRHQLGSGRINARQFLEKIINRYYYPLQKKKDGVLPRKKVNIDYYLEIWFELYSKLTHLSSEMEEIVSRLHNAGFIVSLMSNTFDIHAKSNQLKGFYDIFDYVFLSNKLGMRKPDIEKYKYVLRKLNTKPKKCIFIDDKLSNLVPARELGIIVIKFESVEKFKRQLSELGIAEISKDLRLEIKNKYKQYQMKKKEYKSAKKAYKKAKKEYLKKKNRSLKKRIKRKREYKKRLIEYQKKKIEYEKEKEKKKKELMAKITPV
ncbi:MAG: HAD family hydrolase [Promethearchaeota archaeon]